MNGIPGRPQFHFRRPEQWRTCAAGFKLKRMLNNLFGKEWICRILPGNLRAARTAGDPVLSCVEIRD
jgi:hypothetical protein